GGCAGVGGAVPGARRRERERCIRRGRRDPPRALQGLDRPHRRDGLRPVAALRLDGPRGLAVANGINFTGLASGVDTSSIVTQLMALERAPVTRMSNQIDVENARKSALQD